MTDKELGTRLLILREIAWNKWISTMKRELRMFGSCPSKPEDAYPKEYKSLLNELDRRKLIVITQCGKFVRCDRRK